MFDITLLSKRGKYLYCGEPLTFSHMEENGTVFIFKNSQGICLEITEVNCQKNLWEEINESQKFQELIKKSEVSTNKVHLPKNPE